MAVQWCEIRILRCFFLFAEQTRAVQTLGFPRMVCFLLPWTTSVRGARGTCSRGARATPRGTCIPEGIKASRDYSSVTCWGKCRAGKPCQCSPRHFRARCARNLFPRCARDSPAVTAPARDRSKSRLFFYDLPKPMPRRSSAGQRPVIGRAAPVSGLFRSGRHRSVRAQRRYLPHTLHAGHPARS